MPSVNQGGRERWVCFLNRLVPGLGPAVLWLAYMNVASGGLTGEGVKYLPLQGVPQGSA